MQIANPASVKNQRSLTGTDKTCIHKHVYQYDIICNKVSLALLLLLAPPLSGAAPSWWWALDLEWPPLTLSLLRRTPSQTFSSLLTTVIFGPAGVGCTSE